MNDQTQPNPRKALRDKLLGNKQKQRRTVKLFDAEVEIRQPSVGTILKFQNEGVDTAQVFVDTLLECCYVPGTNEKVFEDTDRQTMLDWPFDESLAEVQIAIAEMTNVNIEAAEDLLKTDPLSS